MLVGGELVTLQAFHMVLSHSRGEAVLWAQDQGQLSWLLARLCRWCQPEA